MAVSLQVQFYFRAGIQQPYGKTGPRALPGSLASFFRPYSNVAERLPGHHLTQHTHPTPHPCHHHLRCCFQTAGSCLRPSLGTKPIAVCTGPGLGSKGSPPTHLMAGGPSLLPPKATTVPSSHDIEGAEPAGRQGLAPIPPPTFLLPPYCSSPRNPCSQFLNPHFQISQDPSLPLFGNFVPLRSFVQTQDTNMLPVSWQQLRLGRVFGICRHPLPQAFLPALPLLPRIL